MYLGWTVTEHSLREVANHSGVLEIGDDFLEPAIRRECEKWVPNIDDVTPEDWVNAYLYVKKKYSL